MPLCLNEDESLEHIFLLCPMARAVWFGSDISLRIDGLRISSIREWIREQLSKPELHQSKALWFYEQFVCILWCIWLYRNEVVFNNQNLKPLKVIIHQKALLQWIAQANHEKSKTMSILRQGNRGQTQAPILPQSQLPLVDRTRGTHSTGTWMLFIEVKKLNCRSWYGASSILRSPKGFNVSIYRSLEVRNKRHT